MKKIIAICSLSLSLLLAVPVIAQKSNFKPCQAKVTASTLNVRHIPSTTGNIEGTFKRNDIVNVIDKSKNTSTVSGVTEYWYKVELPKKKTGWVFGQFITFELDSYTEGDSEDTEE